MIKPGGLLPKRSYNLSFLNSGRGYREARSTAQQWVVKNQRQNTSNFEIFGFRITQDGEVNQTTGKGHVVIGEGILDTCDPTGMAGSAPGLAGDYIPHDWCVHQGVGALTTPLEVQNDDIIWASVHVAMDTFGTSDQQGSSPVEVFSQLGVKVQWALLIDIADYKAAATKPADTYPGGASPFIITYRPIGKVTITGTPKVMKIQQWQIGPIHLGPWFIPTDLDVEVFFPP